MDKTFDKVTAALRDCVAVMDRDLNGLAFIQPELAQAKKALNELDVVDADFAEWNGQGLPPVGIQCERNVSRSNWCPSMVYAHSPCGRFAAFLDSCGMNWSGIGSFRPSRTPEQISAEEMAGEIKRIASHCRLPMADAGAEAIARGLLNYGYQKPTE